jgi:putative hemolysin
MADITTNEERFETFSYAAPEDSFLKRAVIRAIERSTGQPHLKRLYREFQRESEAGTTHDNFFDATVRKLKLSVELDETRLLAAPKAGPLVIVANHPFGVLDGIVICHMMLKLRRDFRILTNSVLYRAPEIREWLLPVDFAETREALATNVKSRAEALKFLKAGGALVVFPAGGVSTTVKPFSRRAVDAEWKPLTAKFVLQAKAPVLPVFFHGQNSRLFQVASHVGQTLRLSLIFHEVYRRIGTKVRVSVGETIPFEAFAHSGGDKAVIMTMLREAVHALEQRAVSPPDMR